MTPDNDRPSDTDYGDGGQARLRKRRVKPIAATSEPAPPRAKRVKGVGRHKARDYDENGRKVRR